MRLYAERLLACSASGIALNSISSNSGSAAVPLLLTAARALVARPGATKSDSGDAYEMFRPTEKSHAWAPHSCAHVEVGEAAHGDGVHGWGGRREGGGGAVSNHARRRKELSDFQTLTLEPPSINLEMFVKPPLYLSLE